MKSLRRGICKLHDREEVRIPEENSPREMIEKCYKCNFAPLKRGDG
jgi:hypothetical protein